jgi:hypothetical protein
MLGLRGTRKSLKGKLLSSQGPANHPKLLALPFSVKLTRLAPYAAIALYGIDVNIYIIAQIVRISLEAAVMYLRLNAGRLPSRAVASLTRLQEIRRLELSGQPMRRDMVRQDRR